MSFPLPDYVYKCPNCGNLVKIGSMAGITSLMSGNTFGAKIYSDGKGIAPMLPDFPKLTKCKKCDTIFWWSKLEEIGGYIDWDNDQKTLCQKADKAKFLEIDDYFKAIEAGIAENENEEFLIRQRIWWAFNDKTRNGKKIFKNANDELRWNDNIKKFLILLDESDINQKIMIAEINRNLGDFENCVRIIQSIDDNGLNWLKKQFINECRRKNKLVIELNDYSNDSVPPFRCIRCHLFGRFCRIQLGKLTKVYHY